MVFESTGQKFYHRDYSVECMIAVGQPAEEINDEEVTLRKPPKEIAIKLK